MIVGPLIIVPLIFHPFCIFHALYKKATDCDRRKTNKRLQKNATRSPAKGVQPAVAHVVSHVQALPKKGRRMGLNWPIK
jgi:hypothetical protein